MDERESPKNNQPIDLSSLDGLTLGTAWTESSAGNRSSEQGDRPRRTRPPFERGDRGERKFDGQRPQGRPGQRPPFRRDGNNFKGRGFQRPQEGMERRGPMIEPPTLKVLFYPEEAPFKALCKAIKASKRTYELFEIARLIIEKPERAVATISQKPGTDNQTPPLFQAADGAVFLTDAEALSYAAKASLEKFFKAEEVEVEAPKGNFVVIHRCGITGKLIAPPNYHRYSALLSEHQAKNLPDMSLAAVQAKLESVKEPELIAQWVESMKKVTRYTLLNQPEGQSPVSFDGIDAAVSHLISNNKAQLIKSVGQARLTAKQIEALPKGELRRSIDAARALQLKFPLETANNLRGRLRRIGFNLYKRGQKGVSYICAVKRHFRTIGQTFTPDVQQVIEFIEKNPMTSDVELPKQMLGINPPPAAHASLTETPGAEQTPAPTSTLTPEEDAAWKKLRQTLQWLIEQGYVTHYGNGKLFVPPARQPNAPKEEGEEEEAAEATTESAEGETPAAEAPVTEAALEAPKIEEKPEEPKSDKSAESETK